MISLRLWLCTVLSVALPLTAAACGVCVEDKIAATYDHAVIAKATRDKRSVLFFEIVGMASRAPPTKEWLAVMVGKTRHVESKSVRVSVEQSAVSFALDTARYPLPEVLKLVDQKLAPHRLSLKLIRTHYQGKLSEPS